MEGMNVDWPKTKTRGATNSCQGIRGGPKGQTLPAKLVVLLCDLRFLELVRTFGLRSCLRGSLSWRCFVRHGLCCWFSCSSFGQRRSLSQLLLRQFLLVEVQHDASHISPRLTIRWHATILFHALRSRIVSSQGFYEIKVVAFNQFPQILCATVHVRLRIKRVGDAELKCSFRHQLHQTLRALRRNRVRIKVALCADHTRNQIGINTISLTAGGDGLVQGDRWRRYRHCCRCSLDCWGRQGWWTCFKTINLFGRDVRVVGSIHAQIQPCDLPNLFATFMGDGKAISQHGQIRSKRCCGQHQYPDIPDLFAETHATNSTLAQPPPPPHSGRWVRLRASRYGATPRQHSP